MTAEEELKVLGKIGRVVGALCKVLFVIYLGLVGTVIYLAVK